MPSSPDARVREIVAAFNAGGIEATARFWHADATLSENPLAPEAGVYRGRDAIMDFLAGFMNEFDTLTETVEEVVDLGEDRYIAVVRFQGRGRASGAEADLGEAWLCTERGGLMIDVSIHPSLETALKAARE